ncbi:MAG: DNA/RNA helicase domain-containing protein, partial [Dehalococcoidia bacterium]
NLDVGLRQHLATGLHQFVADLLLLAPGDALREQMEELEEHGFHFRLTRSLEKGKDYLRERYRDVKDARFGLIASSRDRDLQRFGVPNEFQAVKNIRVGLWYSEPEDAYSGRSCRRLDACATEFYTQGLELDATLLAWGTDLLLESRQWSIVRARRYQKPVRDARQLRLNAYRVLLTRAREACVIFLPELPELDEIHDLFSGLGMRQL